MALALNNYVTVGVNAGSSPVGIYTAPSGYNAVVLCAQATNTTGASEDVTLQHVREVSGVAVTTYASFVTMQKSNHNQCSLLCSLEYVL